MEREGGALQPPHLWRWFGFAPSKRTASEVVEDSVYAIFLTPNLLACSISFIVYALQATIVIIFGQVKWYAQAKEAACTQDQLTPVCLPPDGLHPGWLVLVFFLLLFHTSVEMAKGIQLMVLGIKSKGDITLRFKTILVGFGVWSLAVATTVVAMNFVAQKSGDFVSAVQDVFILLFVLDFDEKVLDFLKHWNGEWTDRLLSGLESSEDSYSA